MGFFGFIADIADATIKVAATPIAAVVDIVEGEPFERTGELLEAAAEDIYDAFDDLLD